MALNGLIFDQRNNTSKNWRNILAEIMGDGILNGCEVTSTSNAITVGGGYFVLHGAVINNNGAETIPITPTLTDGYVRLACRIDLTQEASETGPGQVEWVTDFSATSTFPALTQEDINGSGSIYEGEIAVLQIVSGNITALTRSMPSAEIDAERLDGHSASYFAQDKYARWEGSSAAKPASGITADDANIIWRDGDTVHINLVLRGTINNGWALATLPAACPKPNITRNFAAVCRKSANATAYYAEAVINTAGTISIRAESGDAGVYSAAMIYISYPVRG